MFYTVVALLTNKPLLALVIRTAKRKTWVTALFLGSAWEPVLL